MATKTYYSMGVEDLTKTCNEGLDIYLRTLKDNKVIDDKTYNELANYRIVVNEKGFFGSLLDKLFKDSKQPIYTVTKVLLPSLEKKKDENN